MENSRAPHLGDAEDFLLEVSRKSRQDTVTAIGDKDSFHLLRALFCVGNGGQRNAIFHEAGHEDRAPLASYLLAGVPRMTELLAEIHHFGSALKLLGILSEKLFRQMAASSSGLTFDVRKQSMSQMLPFAEKTLKLTVAVPIRLIYKAKSLWVRSMLAGYIATWQILPRHFPCLYLNGFDGPH